MSVQWPRLVAVRAGHRSSPHHVNRRPELPNCFVTGRDGRPPLTAPLCSVHCALSTVHSPLCTVHSPLSTVHCTLPTVVCVTKRLCPARDGWRDASLGGVHWCDTGSLRLACKPWPRQIPPLHDLLDLMNLCYLKSLPRVRYA